MRFGQKRLGQANISSDHLDLAATKPVDDADNLKLLLLNPNVKERPRWISAWRDGRDNTLLFGSSYAVSVATELILQNVGQRGKFCVPF